MCEGSVTAGFMIVTSMFYTRNEQTLRVGYWCKRASFSDVGFKLITPAVTMSGTGKRDLVMSPPDMTFNPRGFQRRS
jgi:hypothetical protein